MRTGATKNMRSNYSIFDPIATTQTYLYNNPKPDQLSLSNENDYSHSHCHSHCLYLHAQPFVNPQRALFNENFIASCTAELI